VSRSAVLAASAVAGVLALTIPGGVASAASAPAAPVIVDHDNLSNLHLVLDVDSSIAVRFSECGSCGYHWAFVKKPSKVIVKRASHTRAPHNAPGVVGGSGTHTFVFTGLDGGVTTAKLGYYPPGKDEPSRVVTIRLKVRD
jgi:predicted secreted protein